MDKNQKKHLLYEVIVIVKRCHNYINRTNVLDDKSLMQSSSNGIFPEPFDKMVC